MDMMPGNKPCSVLVVEDEALICEMVSEALAERGFDVHAFSNADEALQYLSTHEGVDVLFTDVNLPGQMDGSILAMRAREMRPDLPVVYASGGVSVNRPLRAVPGSRFVPKPYNPTQICSLIASLTAH